MIDYIIRPVREDDFSGVKELAQSTGGGLTSLPDEAEFLKHRITESLLSFDPRVRKPGEQRYLFVLENREKRKIVGVSGIISKVGGFQPFFTYQIKTEVYAYPPLRIHREIDVLHLGVRYNGPSEICSLYMLPEYRKSGLGRLLSLSRFHFMAEFSRRFDREVISELRGVIDENGNSPFWETIGRKFFHQDFHAANFLSGIENKEFIVSLMPKHPLYIPLLPVDAQEVIGKVHRQARPALRMLEGEGFSHTKEVDIFDAGPLVSVFLENVRTIRERKKWMCDRIVKKVSSPERFLLSNARLDFRACLGPVEVLAHGAVVVDEETAEALDVKVGDPITYSPLR